MNNCSHAGGIVFRVIGDVPEFLIVTSRSTPEHWVLPKGHIEPGESPRAAAVREVLEETGVEARIVKRVGSLNFDFAGEPVRSVFFLMHGGPAGTSSDENRKLRWCRFGDAIQLLTFDDSRHLLVRANLLLTETDG